jgi:hypothetical protein
VKLLGQVKYYDGKSQRWPGFAIKFSLLKVTHLTFGDRYPKADVVTL